MKKVILIAATLLALVTEANAGWTQFFVTDEGTNIYYSPETITRHNNNLISVTVWLQNPVPKNGYYGTMASNTISCNTGESNMTYIWDIDYRGDSINGRPTNPYYARIPINSAIHALEKMFCH